MGIWGHRWTWTGRDTSEIPPPPVPMAEEGLFAPCPSVRQMLHAIKSCSNEVDEPAAYYTEWSKSGRQRQILYINAYIWNLERWNWWSYMQGSEGDTAVNNRLLASVGEGEGGMIWENSIETHTLPHIKSMTSASSMHEAGRLKPVLWNSLEGRVLWNSLEGEVGFRMRRWSRGTGIPMATSCRCMSKASTML